jgi:hypothetical protein
MATNNRNKTTTITDSNAKPINQVEMANSLQMMANALKGTYGNGEFDGGLGSIANGYWHRYAMFWDAKLVFTATGSVTITFPYTVVDSMVKVYDASANTASVYYIESSKTLTFTASGKTIVEVSFCKNTKENS